MNNWKEKEFYALYKDICEEREMHSCLTPSDKICVVSFNILLIYYLSTVNLHKIPKFV
jgi:hypothetical protein